MNHAARWRRLIPMLAACASGLLLASAFPPLEWAELAWIAFVPLLLTIARLSDRSAFVISYIAGLVYWCITIFWLVEVTWGGWLLLSLYCALFTGVFGLATAWWCRQWVNDGPARWRFGTMLALPLFWAGSEFLRSVLFTGFPWNPLGGSQFLKIHLLQLSSWTGIYGVSALVMMLNTALFLTTDRYVRDGLRGRRAWHPELMIGFLTLALTIMLGTKTIHKRLGEPTTTLRAAVVQPNIPQYEKWTPEFVDTIYARLNHLTQMAIYAGQPDLVIWPETAVPDYVRDSRRSYALVRDLARLGSPLLVGSMDIAWTDDAAPRYYNSSILFDSAGRLVEAYDKQHLVMFGEYVPLQRLLPFMKAMTPIEASFDAGDKTTIFALDAPTLSFAVLICFEDTVSHLARKAVRNGARLLINQTNDAWFLDTPAARQHLTHSIIRAVENGVPVIRSANTGVSAGIDRYGRLHDVLMDDQGNTFVEGFRVMEVQVPSKGLALTFYTRHGDWFAWTGVLALVMFMGPRSYLMMRERRRV